MEISSLVTLHASLFLIPLHCSEGDLQEPNTGELTMAAIQNAMRD